MKNIIDSIWNNKEWIFSGAGVTIIVWIASWFTNRRKHKLNIKLTRTISFVTVGGQTGPKIPFLSSIITNAGSHTTFVNQPLIITSKKINGMNTYQLIRLNNNIQYPVELSPGKQFSIEFGSQDIEEQILSKLKNRHSIYILASDTLGNKYYSNKMSVKSIKRFNQINYDN